MKQEDKDLLLKDLCARLPYGIKAQIKYYDVACELLAISTNGTTYATTHGDMECLIETFVEDCKPYLFPLSSIGDGQKVEYREEVMKYLGRSAAFFKAREQGKNITDKYIVGYEEIDWFNKNHFDYRGLIEKGLAIDATGLQIY